MRNILSGSAAALAFGAVLAATPSHAGSDNTIHIIQESPVGSMSGNTLSVDQSNADRSQIAGPSLRAVLPHLGLDLNAAQQGGLRPALQIGEKNSADVTMENNGGLLMLHQDSSPGAGVQSLPVAAQTGNTATVSMMGNDAIGAVIQIGTDNSAALSLNSNNARGLIGQFGTNLDATLVVSGAGRSGQIVQVGANHDANLEVTGGSATLTQLGSGATYNNGTGSAAVQVNTTNSGNVTITQIGF